MNPLLKSKLLNFKTNLYLFFESLTKRLLQLTEFLLSLRFLLKFFGASQKALIVDFIFNATEIFISPFNFIFPNFSWRWLFVESTTLAAMIGYFIFAYFIIEVLKVIFQE